MGKRIIVTGGSGKTGTLVIQHLLAQGHTVLNLDLAPLPSPLSSQVHTIKTDLTNPGQVFSACLSHFHLTEPFNSSKHDPLNTPADGIIHLAALPQPLLVPDTETYRVNTLSTYNILEAGCKLGIPKIILASSVCVYGIAYAEGDVPYPSFPIDETIDVDPMDAYGISKVCAERTARGFARRFAGKVDIYAMRLGRVVAPEEYEQAMWKSYVQEPEKWKVHGWSYIDARDFGRMCELCVLRETGKDGFQVFNATNDEITNREETTAFLKRVCPGVEFTREMGQTEAPFSNRKIKEVLGFKEEHNWRKYYKD
ncbi:hypothetical protein MW887_004790 [Aspergillus wentii]|nr:hypothetical protein MW887_004790 [Aspergillus wentii]